MKSLVKIHTLLTALLMLAYINCHAQQASDIQATMGQIMKKHESSEGVTCMTVTKGNGLEMLKMMFNAQFGKDFMKGVTAITLIDYSDASAQTCTILHEDFEAFTALLQEFNVTEDKRFADNEYVRSFASKADSKTISDFVIAIEKGDSKMLMYMSGEIKIQK